MAEEYLKRKIKKREIKALIVQVRPEKWCIHVHTQEAVDTIKQMVKSITGDNCGFFLEERITYE